MYPSEALTIIAAMDLGLHFIAHDLADTWVEDWAAVGLRELEALLEKHAAFQGFLESGDAEPV